MDEKTILEQVAETGRLLLEKRLVARTWGNFSARLDEAQFVITPSGLGYEQMSADDMVRFCLADVTGRAVETVPNTKDVGAIGAAMLIAVGQGIFSDLGEAAALIQPQRRYEPKEENRAVYEKNYRVFRRLYESNKKNFALLNGAEE